MDAEPSTPEVELVLIRDEILELGHFTAGISAALAELLAGTSTDLRVHDESQREQLKAHYGACAGCREEIDSVIAILRREETGLDERGAPIIMPVGFKDGVLRGTPVTAHGTESA